MARKHSKQRHSASTNAGHVVIYGLHSVEAALRNPLRNHHKILLTSNAAKRLNETLSSLNPDTLKIETVSVEKIAKFCTQDAVHQGVYLETSPLPELDIDTICKTANLVVVLDQVSDPHNVGAILRNCAAFGADALIMTQRHGPKTTPTLAKTASGALEHVPIIRVPNLVRALEQLADLHFTRVGLDSEAQENLDDLSITKPIALVLGAEGKGLRRLTTQYCDYLAKLVMPGPIKSLNVSNAAAVALHAIARVK